MISPCLYETEQLKDDKIPDLHSYLFFLFAVFCIPQRIIMSIMCFLAIAIAYVMRVCLSVAITEMVIKANVTENPKNHSICLADPIIPGSSSTPVSYLAD